MTLTSSQLSAVAPGLSMSVDTVNRLLAKYKINTKERIAQFFAQCGHESGSFRYKKENLNYSACTLLRIFSKYYKSTDLAQQEGGNPEKIAIRCYGGRMGNDPAPSIDGYKYCGRGYIQLTGKDNYTAFARSIGKSLDETISYLETNEGALVSALYYWDSRRLNNIATDTKLVTRRINGGENGLADRLSRYQRNLRSLS